MTAIYDQLKAAYDRHANLVKPGASWGVRTKWPEQVFQHDGCAVCAIGAVLLGQPIYMKDEDATALAGTAAHILGIGEKDVWAITRGFDSQSEGITEPRITNVYYQAGAAICRLAQGASQ